MSTEPDAASPPTSPADDAAGPDTAWTVAKRWAMRILPIVLLAAAAWVIWKELHHLRLHEVKHELARWGPGRISASVACVVLSYITLAVNEWAGLRWAGARVPAWTVLWGSFCLNAFAHSLGTAVLVGAAVRLRVYAAHRVTMAEIVKTTAFCNVSFSLGMAGIAGGGLITAPARHLHAVHMAPEIARVAGWALLVGIVAYVALCGLVRGRLSLFGHGFTLPSFRWALAQVAIGVVDNVLTVLIAWVLLPGGLVGLGAFTGAFAVATVTGVVSSVPGGAGVFESVLLTLLPHIPRAPLAAAFLGYRMFYFLIPLVIAGVTMALTGRQPKAAKGPAA
jgi:uncharacterized membrane protein YbhN (UPF0104 family)